MLVHVHAPEKPAFRRRTIGSAVGLLAICIGLASSMSWSGKLPLAQSVIAPDGWSISFRLPAGARAVDLPTELDDGFSLGIRTPSGAIALIRAMRLKGLTEIDLRKAAKLALDAFGSPAPHVVGNLSITWRNKRLGAYDALEVWEPLGGLVVRVGRVRNGEIYAAAYSILRSGTDPDGYVLFDEFCHSVQDQPN